MTHVEINPLILQGCFRIALQKHTWLSEQINDEQFNFHRFLRLFLVLTVTLLTVTLFTFSIILQYNNIINE